MDDPDAAYAMLATCVAGRRMKVKRSAIGLAHTDGSTIYVAAPTRNDLIVELTVQSALLAAGSLESDVLERVGRRNSIIRRYLTLEARRAAHQVAWLPAGIALKMAAAWPGPGPSTVEESIMRAKSDEPIPHAPDHFGTVTGPHRQSRRRRESVPDYQQTPELHDEDNDQVDSTMLGVLATVSPHDDTVSQWLRKNAGTKRGPELGGAGNGIEIAVVGRTGAGAGPARETEGLLGSQASSGVPGESPYEWRYPEWDRSGGQYLPNWCRVVELQPSGDEATETVHVASDRAAVRDLRRMRLSLERRNRQLDGDRLGLRALTEFAVARSTGTLPTDRLYEARRMAGRDVGVVVLLDSSGSAGECGIVGEPIWNEHRMISAQLVSAFEDVDWRVAAYGFHSYGRNEVRFLRAKGFDDRFDRAARRRLAMIERGGFTRLGATIRHATRLLSSQAGTSRRVLLMVSDGFPYDAGYSGRGAEEDTTKALIEAALAGVGSVAVGVESSTDPELLRRIWRGRYVQVASADLVTAHVGWMIRAAIRSAAA